MIHDYLTGVEVNNLVAEGKPEERITIKSLNTNKTASFIKSTGEINVHLVDFKDIAGIGGATFNAYGSRDDGNVVGWNFIKADQEIEFEIEPRDYEDINEVFDLGGYATSGLDITYSSSNEDVAVISGSNEVLIVGVGITEIRANQSGDNLFNAADQEIRLLEVAKADQTISFEAIDDAWVGDVFLNLTAASTSGLPIEFQVIGPATLNGNTLEFEGIGTVQITASQKGNDNYLEADEVKQTFEIDKATQTISFESIEDVLLADQFVDFTAESSAGLDLSYDVLGPASIVGDAIVFHGKGMVKITAHQTGNDEYYPAESVSQTFEVLSPLGNEKDELKLSVYPNPVISTLHVEGVSGLNIQFFNTSGQLVKNIPTSNGIIDVRDLVKGVYTLRIAHEKSWSIRQIIKNN